jgi:catechol 2,3-dioxygenase-like lactoylglutathione lyase family enzyme
MPLPTPILGVDHVALTITDAPRAVEFYGTFLGLEEVARPPSFDFAGAWYKAGDMLIHLVSKPAADAISNRHFCLRVPDLPAAAAYCEAAGLEMKWDNHKIVGVSRFFIRDPDGNRIEFQGPDGDPVV